MIKRVSGYTLIEIAITLLIFSIIAGVGYTRFSGLSRLHRFNSKVNQISDALKLAKYKAIIKQKDVDIRFDSGVMTLITDSTEETVLSLDGLSVSMNRRRLYFKSYGSAGNATLKLSSGNLHRKLIISLNGTIRKE